MWLCLSSVHQSCPCCSSHLNQDPSPPPQPALQEAWTVSSSCQARIPRLGVLPHSSVILGTPHILLLGSLWTPTMWDPDCLRSLCACGRQFGPLPPAVSWPSCLGMGP
ncbi:rCG47744, isoform CRA_a [Rattus norvegicus]|uniref:RCG47744, isoform CRA_a n=1 Tax=Rattus norvegicus TaxID=10116 RepID=A6HXW7_RAT|nr:rCG47744, isoform CRA_a [Rattus norvegicus]